MSTLPEVRIGMIFCAEALAPALAPSRPPKLSAVRGRQGARAFLSWPSPTTPYHVASGWVGTRGGIPGFRLNGRK